MSMDLNTSERSVTAGPVLTPGLMDLQKFMFSDSYHLTASALARVCHLMMGLMLSKTSFNCCCTSLLLLLLNLFLKVRLVYFKGDSTISGTFQCSACSAGEPLTCTSSTINFLGVEGPFLDEGGPSRAVWRNCRLAVCVGVFSQLLKSFSKLLGRLIVLIQWWDFSFLMGSSQWCCLSTASLEKNLVHLLHLWLVLSIKHSIGCLICRISSSVAVNMASSLLSVKGLKCCCNPLLLTWFKKKKNPL